MSGGYSEAIAAIGYEPRSQQADLCRIASMQSGVHAVQAPTATGKSLGGLIGAAMHVVNSNDDDARAIVSTHSNLLREQYMNHDLPAVQRAFPNLKFYSIAGATHYVCVLRGLQAADEVEDEVLEKELRDWLSQLSPDHETQVSDAPKHLRKHVRADVDACGDDARCKDRRDLHGCGFRNARASARDAHVIVTNHALSVINAMAGGAVLGSFTLAIVDEGHTFGESLRSNLQQRVTSKALQLKINVLPEASDRIFELGDEIDRLYVADDRPTADRHEYWARPFDATRMSELTDSLASTTVESIKQIDLSMKDCEAHHLEKCGECEERLRRRSVLTQLLKLLRTTNDWLDCCTRPSVPRSKIGTLLREGHGAKKRNVLLVTPVDISESVEAFVNSVRSMTIMSATLGSESDHLYALTSADMANHVTSYTRLPSVFDYPRVMDVVIDVRMRARLETKLYTAVAKHDGRALILTGSHRRKDTVANILSENDEAHVLRQPSTEKADERSARVEEFKRDEESILVGTKSYYEGINIVGPSLSHVIIEKIPTIFNGPLKEQLYVNLSAQGKTFFEVHDTPYTEMALEQMIGRLIRSDTDTGSVTFIGDDVTKGTHTIMYTMAWFRKCAVNAAKRFGINDEDIAYITDNNFNLLSMLKRNAQ